jgi:excisionase family DNA binding protein
VLNQPHSWPVSTAERDTTPGVIPAQQRIFPLSKSELKAERFAYSPTEVAERLGKSRSFVNGEIAKGRLKARRMGVRMVITNDDGRDYLASLPVMKPSAA